MCVCVYSHSSLTQGWIAWDTQTVNAAPQTIVWQRESPAITLRVPGLYRVAVCVFTTEPALLQLHLNDEPVLALQPELGIGTPNTPQNTVASSVNSNLRVSGQGAVSGNIAVSGGLGGEGGGSVVLASSMVSDVRYTVRRARHSAGEVTALSLDECLSLPPDARLCVRFYSKRPAQGFLSIKKL